jgi:apolipoprotein N-acyltransferase
VKPRVAYPVALLSGALLSLAFPEPSLSFLTWFVLAPTLALTRGVGVRRSAIAWGLFALGFLGTLLIWISIAGWVAWGLALVVEVPFLVLFGALWGWASGATGPTGRIAAAGGLWAGIEYLRSVIPFGGFTWGQLAQSQHDLVWMLEWAALGGGIVLAGVLVGVNAAIVEIVVARRDPRSIAIPALVIVAAFVVPIVSSFFYVASDVTPLRVALIQGNADPDVPVSLEKDIQILQSHVELTGEITATVDVAIWPESSIALDPELPEVQDALAHAATSIDAPLIVGANENVDDDHYRVSQFLVSPEGEIVDRYRKTHLVPFGEYVPLRDLLDSIPILDQVPRDAIAGDEGKLFDVNGIDVTPVISYEGDFGSLVRGRIASGGDVLVVATNTSTWLHSWASAQHVAFSQVRAAENATPVIHAAISGISAFISDRGEVLESLPLYRATSAVRSVAPRVTTTPYTRFGDWILAVCLVGCAAIWGTSRKRQKVGVVMADPHPPFVLRRGRRRPPPKE